MLLCPWNEAKVLLCKINWVEEVKTLNVHITCCIQWTVIIQSVAAGRLNFSVQKLKVSVVAAGTVRRKAGSCCGCALGCFLPVTCCCRTSSATSSPRSTTRCLETACRGCTKRYGNTSDFQPETIIVFGVDIFFSNQFCCFLSSLTEMDPGSTLLIWWKWRPSNIKRPKSSIKSTSPTTQTRSDAQACRCKLSL